MGVLQLRVMYPHQICIRTARIEVTMCFKWKKKENDTLRIKTIPLIGENINPIVLATIHWINESLCMSVIGSEPSNTIMAPTFGELK